MVKLIECPRDAMQGIKEFISTDDKANYINKLLKVGFDTIDFGSFVSPKAIPQMRDTAAVLKQLNLENSTSKLSAIVANKRGADDAVAFDEISYLGYPFSVSETFQQRNTNSSIEESLSKVEKIQSLCVNRNKELLLYISMAFGNPYEDEWSADIVADWSRKINNELGIKLIALSDTIGVSNPKNIHELFGALIPELTEVEFGAHLHTNPTTWKEKVESAYNAGCRRFDGAIKGFGGCPMAKDDLVGNMATENMIQYFNQSKIEHNLNMKAFNESLSASNQVFG